MLDSESNLGILETTDTGAVLHQLFQCVNTFM